MDVATVGDLVDLAAEARTRVLLDESSRVFFVVASGLLFRCATHAEAASAPTAELVLPPLEDEEAATPRA